MNQEISARRRSLEEDEKKEELDEPEQEAFSNSVIGHLDMARHDIREHNQSAGAQAMQSFFRGAYSRSMYLKRISNVKNATSVIWTAYTRWQERIELRQWIDMKVEQTRREKEYGRKMEEEERRIRELKEKERELLRPCKCNGSCQRQEMKEEQTRREEQRRRQMEEEERRRQMEEEEKRRRELERLEEKRRRLEEEERRECTCRKPISEAEELRRRQEAERRQKRRTLMVRIEREYLETTELRYAAPTDWFLYLSKPYHKHVSLQWKNVKSVRLLPVPRESEDMDAVNVNDKYPLSQWLMNHRKHQHHFFEFNGVSKKWRIRKRKDTKQQQSATTRRRTTDQENPMERLPSQDRSTLRRRRMEEEEQIMRQRFPEMYDSDSDLSTSSSDSYSSDSYSSESSSSESSSSEVTLRKLLRNFEKIAATGQLFLKYTVQRRRRRIVKVSFDNKYRPNQISWGSGSQHIDFSEIQYIAWGHWTPVFQARKNSLKKELCFSVVGNRQILDLQAQNREMAQFWVKGLRKFIGQSDQEADRKAEQGLHSLQSRKDQQAEKKESKEDASSEESSSDESSSVRGALWLQERLLMFEKIALMGQLFVHHIKEGNRKQHDGPKQIIVAVSFGDKNKPEQLSWGGGSYIDFSEIEYIAWGHWTPAFQARKDSLKKELCFSVVGKKQILDLQAQSREMAELWVKGLRKLTGQSDQESDRIAQEQFANLANRNFPASNEQANDSEEKNLEEAEEENSLVEKEDDSLSDLSQSLKEEYQEMRFTYSRLKIRKERGKKKSSGGIVSAWSGRRFPKHEQLQQQMNDIPNAVELIDPNKYSWAMDHSFCDLDEVKDILDKMEFTTYHHSMPSVFQVNEEGTECKLMSEIAGLSPYGNLYPLITELFLHQLPQFECVLGLKLRCMPLKVVVKATDYELIHGSERDVYLWNGRKEKLYEKIAAVGLYYYQINEGVTLLDLSSEMFVRRDALPQCEVAVMEGSSLVYDKELCYHRAEHFRGAMKVISFCLLKNDFLCVDASQVIVNWVFHCRHYVEESLGEIVDNSHGNEWLIHLVQDYVVGGKDYIAKASDLYRNARRYGVGH